MRRINHKLLSQRLLALLAAGVLFLNYPLIDLWAQDTLVWAWPLFPLALYGIWALLIACLAWLMEREPD